MIWRKADLIDNPEAMSALLTRIRAAADTLELTSLGVADPSKLPEPARLDNWLAAGCQAEMTYLSRHRELRLDPNRFFPGVAAIICVAVGYLAPTTDEGAGTGDNLRISRYAQGSDYHTVIKDRLHLLLAEIRSMVPEVKGRVAVDTAPVLERHWAQEAGLGWIGRNRCLITSELGSWVFLGELLLDLPLPANSAGENRCGDCRRCLDACPTAALDGQQGLDSRACIAYWNVEHRGDFTAETPPMSPWLFGCDRCQEVCPWNVKAHGRSLAALAPREGREATLPRTASEWADLQTETFDKYLVPTAMERTGLSGLRRNARRLLAENELGESR